MKKIAVIGANEFQNPLILKAKAMGFETHVFAWEAGDIGERNADYFYPISIIEKDKILRKCREIGVSSVVSVGSDLAVLTVNHIARAMGFPCNSEWTDLVSTNKFMMRETFEQSGIPTPKHISAHSDGPFVLPSSFSYPVVVKPTDRSGSRGVKMVTDPSELKAAILEACKQSFSDNAIVEEYIEGPEYSCECISWNGCHRILAYTKKYTTGAPHFIETGHDQPSDIPQTLIPAVNQTMLNVLDTLEISWGAAHIEFRITSNGSARIIEAGARMGGDCIGSDLVELSTGHDFLRMVIDVSCGKEPDFCLVRKPAPAAIRFIMNANDVTVFEEIKRTAPEKIWRASEFQRIKGPITHSAARLGYYILREQ